MMNEMHLENKKQHDMCPAGGHENESYVRKPGADFLLRRPPSREKHERCEVKSRRETRVANASDTQRENNRKVMHGVLKRLVVDAAQS